MQPASLTQRQQRSIYNRTGITLALPLVFRASVAACGFLGMLTGQAATHGSSDVGGGVPAVPPLLTNAIQIKRLTAGEAAAGYPVRLRATVTHTIRNYPYFIQDETGAAYVIRARNSQRLSPGQIVEVEGVTTPGGFAPSINETQVRVVGKGELPPPYICGFEELMSGSLDARFVEVRGIVRSVTVDARNRFLGLEMMVGGARLLATVYDFPDQEAAHLVDAMVKVRGCVGCRYNDKRQLVTPTLNVPSPGWLVVEEAPPADPFSIPVEPISELLRFSVSARGGHRAKVSGVVTAHTKTGAAFIRDAEHALRVFPSDRTSLVPGQRVEVVGFPEMAEYSPVLKDAVCRIVGVESTPAPRDATSESLLKGSFDADLVAVEGRLLDAYQRLGESIFLMESGGVRFQALLGSPGPPPDLRLGSRLRMIGNCVIHETSMKTSQFSPRGFQLRLRSPDDIQILRQPSWWTRARLVSLAEAIGLLFLLALAWVVLLQRRVRQQMALIRAKLEQEAVLKERTRLAREFHDSLEQDLAGINMQLEVAHDALRSAPHQVGSFLQRACQMARRSLVEARRSVWDLRSSALRTGSLAEALKAVTEMAAQESALRCDFQATGPQQRLSGVLESNLLRIGQEAVANALKHSRAKKLTVQLHYETGRVRLEVQDDGCGFEVTEGEVVMTGHFGLLGMRERTEKLGGTFCLQSQPGHGTTLTVVVPFFEPSPQAATEEVTHEES